VTCDQVRGIPIASEVNHGLFRGIARSDEMISNSTVDAWTLMRSQVLRVCIYTNVSVLSSLPDVAVFCYTLYVFLPFVPFTM